VKIVSIVGARPEFIQAAPVSRAIRREHQEILVHTGQHYDEPLSAAFFQELTIPSPNYNLAVGPGSHNQQTARVMVRLEEVLNQERPDLVLVRGDTNSTLGSALAASKMGIPLAHIEAGERSFDRQMPEEINRVVTDRLSDIHFCASHHALDQLAAEGIVGTCHWVGDVMLDAMLHYRPIAKKQSRILARLGLAPSSYSLITIHRVSNTVGFERLDRLVDILNQLDDTVVFPLHPRTRQSLAGISARFRDHVRVIEPVPYLDMIMLEESARLIATDSGGVQREAYFLRVPCLTLRDETEWVETVEAGWNRVVGVDPGRVLGAWRGFVPPEDHPPIFGDGRASQRIVEVLDGLSLSGRPFAGRAEALAGINEPMKLGIEQ